MQKPDSKYKTFFRASSIASLMILSGCQGQLSANLYNNQESESTAGLAVAIVKELHEKTVEVQWGLLFQGDSAIDLAMIETDCKPLEILECAPTLKNGYYVSTLGEPFEKIAIHTDAKLKVDGVEKEWDEAWGEPTLQKRIKENWIVKIQLEGGEVIDLQEFDLPSTL